jgi:uncharacterized protein
MHGQDGSAGQPCDSEPARSDKAHSGYRTESRISRCSLNGDHRKAVNNEEKHGITFPDAMTISGDPLELTIADADHSHGEYRFLSIGRSHAGNLVVASSTEKDADRIRIISARRVTKQEQQNYEQDGRFR